MPFFERRAVIAIRSESWKGSAEDFKSFVPDTLGKSHLTYTQPFETNVVYPHAVLILQDEFPSVEMWYRWPLMRNRPTMPVDTKVCGHRTHPKLRRGAIFQFFQLGFGACGTCAEFIIVNLDGAIGTL